MLSILFLEWGDILKNLETKTCKKCKTQNALNNRYCTNCGYDFQKKYSTLQTYSIVFLVLSTISIPFCLVMTMFSLVEGTNMIHFYDILERTLMIFGFNGICPLVSFVTSLKVCKNNKHNIIISVLSGIILLFVFGCCLFQFLYFLNN